MPAIDASRIQVYVQDVYDPSSSSVAAQPHPPIAFQPPTSAHQPWGPLVYRVPCQGRRNRLLAAVLAACAAGVLSLALVLKPSPTGHGTHEQLGLAPCNFLAFTGYPCPTCGMTTAFAWTVRGRWLVAAQVQPMGFLLAIATLAALGGALSALTTGRTWAVNWLRISPTAAAVALLGLFLAAWAYTIVATLMAHAAPAAG
jgi:hypothetical protein